MMILILMSIIDMMMCSWWFDHCNNVTLNINFDEYNYNFHNKDSDNYEEKYDKNI